MLVFGGLKEFIKHEYILKCLVDLFDLVQGLQDTAPHPGIVTSS